MMIGWTIVGILVAISLPIWIARRSQRNNKRSVHVFLDGRIEASMETAIDVARTGAEVHDLDAVIKSRRLFVYSIDAWPREFQPYATGVVEDNKRQPKGTVVTRAYWGNLEAGGMQLNWGCCRWSAT